jgi:hypothetical protein
MECQRDVLAMIAETAARYTRVIKELNKTG